MKQAATILTLFLLVSHAVAQPAPPLTPPVAQPDWITTTNQPCKVWNPQPQPNETVTWSGGCKDGLAAGQGVLQWFVGGKPDMKFEGIYLNGKRNGPGVIILPDGQRQSGAWINDEPLRGRGGAI